MKRHVFLVALMACSPRPADHDDQGDHDDHGEATWALSQWTDTHELFVELDSPVVGKPITYHAHVTRLSDNQPATQGSLTVRLSQGEATVWTHTFEAPARDGIFVGSSPAPTSPGVQTITFTFVDGEHQAEWQSDVAVGDHHASEQVASEEGEISFLKEAQWQVPFAVEPANRKVLVPTITAAATVRSAPEATHVVAAASNGLLLWTDALPVVGRTVKRGERVATLLPSGATESWGRLQADLTGARANRALADQDLARLEGLLTEQLVPARRVDEARNAATRAVAEVRAAERRIQALTSESGGQVAITAPTSGVIVHVGAEHGEAIQAGTALVTVSSGPEVLLQGHTHDHAWSLLDPVATLTVHRGDWPAPIDLLAHGGELLSSRLIFDPHTLSAPLTARITEDLGLQPGDLVALEVGVGTTEPTLSVPRTALVEVNAQTVVFVQTGGESFTRRRVVTGNANAHDIEILRGLDVGERVVTLGGFDVHVASLSASLESHHH